MSENLCWKKIQQGDRTAFKTLFKSTYKQLVIVAINILEDRDDAEDVVQSVFLQLWNKRTSLNIKGELMPYLTSSIRNKSLNILDKHKSRTKYQEYLASKPIDASQYLSDPFFAEKLEKAIQDLPARCRLIFTKNRIKGMKNKEIADELKLSIKTVENQVGKAIFLMREALKDYLPILVLAAF